MANRADRCRHPKPRDLFRAAERHAIVVRKLLKKLQKEPRFSDAGGAMSDTVRLALMIERLARMGLNRPAVEAVDISGRIEHFVSMLNDDVDSILRARNASRLAAGT